jgi:putative transposase
MTAIRDGGEGFPLKSAWRDVRDLKQIYGWQWPDYQAVLRRWKALPEAQKLHARIGHSEAVKRLAMPALRDKTTIGPLEWVSLDGRSKDFWAHNGDGKPRRYTFLALVDCATKLHSWLDLGRKRKRPRHASSDQASLSDMGHL